MLKIQHVHLLTDHLAKLEEFYGTQFGLPIVERQSQSFTVKAGRSYLTFSSTHISGDNPYYHFAFDIPSNKIKDAKSWLQSKAISLNVLPNHSVEFVSSSWNSTSIYFYDPAGNIVELIVRHDLRNERDTSFHANHLLSISELGIVVPDVVGVTERLTRELSIHEYKGSVTENFAALGSVEGLLILSEYDRVWLGSNKPARYFKTEVQLEGVRTGSYTISDLPYFLVCR